jgi:anti-anti-sigma regulatory factor
MSTRLESFSKDGLTIQISKIDGGVTMAWEGISDAREPERVLGTLLRRLATELKGQNATMDFRRFEYMNSATVSLIIQFIKLLDEQGTPLTLIYDTEVGWQRINCQCMRAIARTLNHLQVKGV